jgi:molybdenum cofactor cytidylyltransferase
MKNSPVIVVLGAGKGSRYKGPRHKLSEPLGGHSVLSSTVRNAIASGLPVLVVTTPAFVDEAAQWIARRDVVVLGQHSGGVAPGGMGDSIAAGVAARSSAAGWIVLPADMPLVKPATLLKVAAALAQHPVAFAQHKGRRGHPVAFAAELFSDLLRLSGEEGARRILARYPAQGIEVDDPGVLLDMDTTEDLIALRAQWPDAAGLTTD